jgi:lipopolysaccharide/colanic/teichoic acid biosynthesis glycosyltransferase
MIPNAEELTGPRFAVPNDPRTTRVGLWLRRTSLDELPQLINVVRGEMSLVGPRPERPEFVARFRERYPEYMSRHRVRAGITGWAQVHDLRGQTSIRKRIAYDLYYIDNWSLALDFKIMWLTMLRFLRHRHAY